MHYDENDRLAQADVYGDTLKTTTYQYNPLGQRIVQNRNGRTLHIHYNAQGQRIAESDESGNLIREYLYLGNQPIALVVAQAGEQASQPSAPVEPWILDSEAANTLITGVWRVSSHYPDYQGTGYRYSPANQSITSSNTIDTDQATLVGTWHTSTATPGYIGPNYRYAAKGDGTTSATWPVAANGNKDLWVIYTSGSNRASNATYTVHHANGQTNVTVDQSQNGGTWALLGNFNLDANSKVVLTNLANSYVIADGIRIGDDSNNPEYASVTWPITVPQTGRYKVYGTWNSGSSRASNAKYTINAGPNQHTSIQNQRLNGGQWNLLGEYSFDIADNANGQNNVSLSAEANGYLIADAIKLELIEDNQPTPIGLFFIHNDHLGTPKRLTDTQGEVVWSLQTTPFGEIHEEIANGITLLNGFPGQYRDSETGLSYNYYRDYDPSIGRYIESDPIGLGGGMNTYGYVEMNPISRIDLLGLVYGLGNGSSPYSQYYVVQKSAGEPGVFGPVCGARGSLAAIMFIPDGSNRLACQAHDDCYATCGKTKEQCDMEFVANGAPIYSWVLSDVFKRVSKNAYDNAQVEAGCSCSE